MGTDGHVVPEAYYVMYFVSNFLKVKSLGIQQASKNATQEAPAAHTAHCQDSFLACLQTALHMSLTKTSMSASDPGGSLWEAGRQLCLWG